MRQHFRTVVAAVITVVLVAAVPSAAHVTESWTHLRNKHVRPFTDKRYFKKVDLQTADAGVNEAGDPVHWTNLAGVPAGFADGADADSGGDVTGVTAGSGLTGGGDSGAVTLSVDATSVQSRVSDTCGAGSAIREITQNGTVTCETDDDTTYTGSQGVAVVGTDVQLDDCSANQVWKRNPGDTAWECASDNDTTYTGSEGVAVTGTDIHLADCASDELWKRNSTDTAWVCSTDVTAVGDGTTISNAAFPILSIASGGVQTSHIATDAVNKDKIADEPAAKGGDYFLGTVDTTLGSKASVSATFPANGLAVVVSQAQFNRAALNTTGYLAVELREGAMTLDSWRWDPGDADGLEDARQGQVSVISVASGSHTFDLVMATDAASVPYDKANLVVLFFATGL